MAPNPFPHTIDLAALGANGFKIQGENPGDLAGWSVAAAGDINGDGFADLIVGAPINSGAGAAYVVFGTVEGFPALLDLGDLDGANGFKIQGETAGDNAGHSVSAAGDINGDGVADLIVGAQYNSSGGTFAGAAYVVFGRPASDPFQDVLDLGDLDGANGFKIQGEAAFDRAGHSVSAVGDINGDGVADLIVSAPLNASGGTYAGAAYVVFGTDGDFDPVIGLAGLDGGNGFKIQGEAAFDWAGRSVSGAGDINGDGVDDLIVGAHLNDGGSTYAGAAYVVFGRPASDPFPDVLDLGDLDGANGFKIQGEAAFDFAGHSVSGAGDINGDGVADLIVGAQENDGGGPNAGAAYVVFGRPASDPFPDVLDLAGLDGANGFKIQGENPGDRAGCSVSAAGDINGDGIADLIVGAYGNGTNAGAAYVVFGTDEGFPALVDLAAVAQGQGGFKIQGEAAFNQAGRSVAGAGDVDGDGVDDLVVGAYGNNSGGGGAGAAYVIFGNIAPVAADDVGAATAGQLATLDILSNDTDANGFLVPASISLVDLPAKGTAVVNDGKVDYTPALAATGEDSFTYTVRDDQGGISDTATVTVTIAPPPNDPPTANPDSAATAYLTPVVIPVLANDTDPDGTLDPTTVTITTPPGSGVAVANADGTITFTPGIASLGTVGFAYTVQDDQGAVSNPAGVTVAVGGEIPQIVGTSGANTLLGGNGKDAIFGLAGNDILYGQGGADLVFGGAGNDTIYAGPGDDILFGEAGNDNLFAEQGANILFGGAGNDRLLAGSGNDILVGGPGDDTLQGHPTGTSTAVYAGPVAAYAVQRVGNITFVQDLQGNEGRDTLATIDLLQFEDGFLATATNSFTPNAFATPAVQALVTTPGFTTDPGPFTPGFSQPQVENLVAQGEAA